MECALDDAVLYGFDAPILTKAYFEILDHVLTVCTLAAVNASPCSDPSAVLLAAFCGIDSISQEEITDMLGFSPLRLPLSPNLNGVWIAIASVAYGFESAERARVISLECVNLIQTHSPTLKEASQTIANAATLLLLTSLPISPHVCAAVEVFLSKLELADATANVVLTIYSNLLKAVSASAKLENNISQANIEFVAKLIASIAKVCFENDNNGTSLDHDSRVSLSYELRRCAIKFDSVDQLLDARATVECILLSLHGPIDVLGPTSQVDLIETAVNATAFRRAVLSALYAASFTKVLTAHASFLSVVIVAWLKYGNSKNTILFARKLQSTQRHLHFEQTVVDFEMELRLAIKKLNSGERQMVAAPVVPIELKQQHQHDKKLRRDWLASLNYDRIDSLTDFVLRPNSRSAALNLCSKPTSAPAVSVLYFL